MTSPPGSGPAPATLAESLREARRSRVAVLHEFWTLYDPSKARVHAFLEGHEDVAFYSHHIEKRAPRGVELRTYRCDGKRQVYEAFEAIVQRVPDVKGALFFVDKDLDDILGKPWPTDPRIFVTDVYSIENYFVAETVLLRMVRDCVKLTGCAFEELAVAEQFRLAHARFSRLMLPVMAWILVARRMGLRPNLGKLSAEHFIELRADGVVARRHRVRVAELTRHTGVELGSGSVRRLRDALRELSRNEPKRVIRGKFELWFLVAFYNRLLAELQALAKEVGGSAKVKRQFTTATVVGEVPHHVVAPRSLELFLQAHLSTARAEHPKPRARFGDWLGRLFAGWRG